MLLRGVYKTPLQLQLLAVHVGENGQLKPQEERRNESQAMEGNNPYEALFLSQYMLMECP